MTVRPLKTQFLISLRVALLLSKVVSNNVYIIIYYLESRTKIHLPTRHPSGAPNDQFVEKCIIIPQVMKIYVMKAFSSVFQYCWEKIICSFFPARHTRNFPARKIKLVGFPAICKVSSQQAGERQFSTSYVKMGVAKGLKSTLPLGWVEGGGKTRTLLFKLSPPMQLCFSYAMEMGGGRSIKP